MRVESFLRVVFTSLVLFFLYIPVLAIVVLSFRSSRFGGSWDGFSLKWYEVMLRDPTVLKALWNSLVVALSSSTLSTIIGVAAAYGLYLCNANRVATAAALVFLPLALPDIVVGISVAMFLRFLSIELGRWTVVVAHVDFGIAYVAAVVVARLAIVDGRIGDAARDLGASEAQVFFRVFLPQIWQSVVASAVLCFSLSFDDFVVAFFTSGVGATTLPIKIFSMLRFSGMPTIDALCSLLFLVSVCAILFFFVFQNGESDG